jgi:hypothetical protein
VLAGLVSMREAGDVRSPLAVLPCLLLAGCASEPPPQAVAPAEERRALAPMSPADLRAAWSPLAADEAALADDLGALSTLSPDERLRRLTRMRDAAGMLGAGLARLRPPPELVSCRDTARQGADSVKQALDGIHELWMGRVSGGRADADRLAAALCDGFARVAQGRAACGVVAPVPVPASCKP